MSNREIINLSDTEDYADSFFPNNEAFEKYQFLPAESPVRETVGSESKLKGPLDAASSEPTASGSKRPMFTITTEEFKRRRQTVDDLHNEVFTLGHQVEGIQEKTLVLEKRANHQGYRIESLREDVDGMMEDETILEVQREINTLKGYWELAREEFHEMKVRHRDRMAMPKNLENKIDNIDRKLEDWMSRVEDRLDQLTARVAATEQSQAIIPP